MSVDWFNEFVNALPDFPCWCIWSSKDEILCKSESAANTIAELIEHLYASQQQDILVNTGYYDPLEDEKSGEVDKFTGWWYVGIY